MKILKGIFTVFKLIWVIVASAWLMFTIKMYTTDPKLIEHRKKCLAEIKEAWKNKKEKN